MPLLGNLKQNGVQSEYERFLATICAKSPDDALSALKSSQLGLSRDLVEEQREAFGLNVLPIRRTLPFPFDLLERFKNPLVIQLLLICILCAIMGDIRSVIVVGGMIFLSVFLSYFQEKSCRRGRTVS